MHHFRTKVIYSLSSNFLGWGGGDTAELRPSLLLTSSTGPRAAWLHLQHVPSTVFIAIFVSACKLGVFLLLLCF